MAKEVHPHFHFSLPGPEGGLSCDFSPLLMPFLSFLGLEWSPGYSTLQPLLLHLFLSLWEWIEVWASVSHSPGTYPFFSSSKTRVKPRLQYLAFPTTTYFSLFARTRVRSFSLLSPTISVNSKQEPMASLSALSSFLLLNSPTFAYLHEL